MKKIWGYWGLTTDMSIELLDFSETIRNGGWSTKKPMFPEGLIQIRWWQTAAQFITWWLILLGKWSITSVIHGIRSRVNPLITGVITHLLSGMSHQEYPLHGPALRKKTRYPCSMTHSRSTGRYLGWGWGHYGSLFAIWGFWQQKVGESNIGKPCWMVY